MSIKLMNAVWESPIKAPERWVLLAIADSCSDEGVGWPSVSTLCRKCVKKPRTLQKQLSNLEDMGLLKREFRNGRSTRYHLDLSILTSVTDDTPVIRDTPSRVTPTPQSQMTPTSVTDDTQNHKEPFIEPPLSSSRSKYSEWDMEAAIATEGKLLEAGNLDKTLTDAELERWADEFRKLREIDHKSEELISTVMTWLFDEDDFWISSGNFCSAMTLRKKTNGSTRFKQFEIKARTCHNGNGKKGPRTSFDQGTLKAIIADTAAYHAARTGH